MRSKKKKFVPLKGLSSPRVPTPTQVDRIKEILAGSFQMLRLPGIPGPGLLSKKLFSVFKLQAMADLLEAIVFHQDIGCLSISSLVLIPQIIVYGCQALFEAARIYNLI